MELKVISNGNGLPYGAPQARVRLKYIPNYYPRQFTLGCTIKKAVPHSFSRALL
jgi:hypothetical protein